MYINWKDKREGGGMSKHTPGPWFVSISDATWNRYNLNDNKVCDGDTEEEEANRKLIAAAPDLLEALIGIVNDLEERSNMKLYTKGVVDVGNSVYVRAKNAIAKATGGKMSAFEAETEDRLYVLLKAAYDLLRKCNEGPYVLNALSTAVFYDGVECDGMRLANDIAIELGLEEIE